VIVFDRIRENAPRMPRATFSQIVNRSMSDVLTRSLATSFSTLLGITAIFMFGGETLQDFAFALLVGILSGTYSSIFIAAPVLTEWKERDPAFRQRRRRIEADLGYVPAYAPIPGAPGEEAEPAPRRARRAAEPEVEREPEPVAPVATMELEPDGDGVPPDGGDGANGAPQVAGTEEPAPVGGDRDPARAERAARKKQRQQRQRSRRKHGRRR